MRREPALASPQQLLDLGVVDPVVLVVVEHRQQDVQVIEQIGQSALRRESQADVAARAPLRISGIQPDRLDVDPVPQRLEQSTDELRAALGGHDGDPGLQRDRRGRQLLMTLARPGHRGLEHRHQRHRHERRRDVGPVVHVLREGEARGAAASPHQTNGIDVDQQRDGAPLRRGLRIEDARPPERQRDRLLAVRVLVQQKAQVRRRLMRRRHREQHPTRLSVGGSVTFTTGRPRFGNRCQLGGSGSQDALPHESRL